MRRPSLLLLALFASGCFLDRSVVGANGAPDAQTPDQPEAGVLPDAGPDRSDDDASTSMRDADVPPVPDAGRDAGPQDAGCSPAETRCEGQTAHVCGPDGVLTSTLCAENQFCEDRDGEDPRCKNDVCTPDDTRCAMGDTVQETCAVDGSEWEPAVPCERGCTSNQCRPETWCDPSYAAVDANISPGDTPVPLNLCGAGDDHSYGNDSDDCPDQYSSNGEDRLVRLNIAQGGRYCIHVYDSVSGDGAVDAVVYLRGNECGPTGTQIDCANDGGSNLDARLREDLGPGDYFIVVDSYDYDDHGCGQVEVEVTSC